MHDADLKAVAKLAERLARGVSEGFRPNAGHCERCRYHTRCQLDAERPAAPESPPVWPTFKFPD